MATVQVLVERDRAVEALRAQAPAQNTLADGVCSYTAMGGAVVGVIAGAILGHSTGTNYPDAFGAGGGILGSIAAAVAGQFLFLPLCGRRGG